MKSIFTVLYKAKIKPNCEDAYKKAWYCCAEYFVKHCGALGSQLFKTDQGEWIAVSRWPDRATRNSVWGDEKLLPKEVAKLISELKASLESYTETELELIDEIKETV